MKGKNINLPASRPRVLVAPLNWGLGHATRCIPVIFKLLQENCEIVIATGGECKILLQKEFPDLDFVELKGYGVQYSRNKYRMPLKLLLQFPKLFYRILAEKRWLKKIIRQYKIDAVISDNRFGLNHEKIPCVYITHQLKIKTGNSFTGQIAQKIHYHFINKFKVCWVPDAGGEINLAGELSHPAVLPDPPVIYLGPLSRFEKKEITIKYDLCIILSGPEPQRTVFEKIILKGLDDFSGSVLFVRGLPGKTFTNELKDPAIEIKNHLPAAELNLAIQQSKLIICRSGYTTVMDLVKLQKKAILVPTPGQTEQEYLAKYLLDKKIFYCTSQHNFSLSAEIKKAMSFPDNETTLSFKDYKAVIENFVKDLKKIKNEGI
jgi:uncharacterized protein (TIGR00661 family)